MKSIAERIKQTREGLGITQEDAGALLGLSKRGYQDRERKGEFPLADIVALADAFGVSLDLLLAGRDGTPKLSDEKQRLLRGWDKIGPEDKLTIFGIINDALLDFTDKN